MSVSIGPGAAIHRDAVWTELAGQRPAEADERRLGGAVGHLGVGAAALGRDRRDAYDASEPGGEHRGHDPPGHQERAPHVDVEDAVPLGDGQVQKVDRGAHPGHVGQADDRQQAGLDLGDGRLDRVRVDDIGGDAERRRPVAADLGGRSRFAASPSRSRMAIDQPSRASRSAVARPMPTREAAPVMTAVRSPGNGLSASMGLLPSGRGEVVILPRIGRTGQRRAEGSQAGSYRRRSRVVQPSRVTHLQPGAEGSGVLGMSWWATWLV